jgi:hypothetical protein
MRKLLVAFSVLVSVLAFSVALTACGGSSDSSSNPAAAAEKVESDSPISGPACQDDLYSAECREEATERENEIAEEEGLGNPEEQQAEVQSAIEEAEEGSEENEYEDSQALEELDNERQEEIENE